MSSTAPTRDEIFSRYLDLLEHDPYPVQEAALLAWFESEQGVLVCAPTGMGKTLIAEAALFEALQTGKTAYYTTPLIALTEQKFREMQQAAVRWGFQADDVGLVTGNRCVNPDATVLVVVAEILLNRLLHPTAFDFSDVAAVVMDEFHSFNDRERGIVWELSLGLLPPQVRLLLLSATVGNSAEFVVWLQRSHNRRVRLIQSTERRVPLRYEWVGESLLNEHVESIALGDDETRRTPALIFCFNREQCWTVAEQLKGKNLVDAPRRKQLIDALEDYDWSGGAGPKLKRVLMRGVGVHHAGLLPKYRRVVEDLFQQKLLSVAVCTETLAAGINLPARSVLLTSLIKGPPGRKTLMEASSAHQMFGRAGRPQFDTEGYVYAIAHEDDVKILRWKEKYDQIPEDTKDPNLIRAKKRLKKKMPTRRKTVQYWNESQFEKLKTSPPGKLSSRGEIPWRLLAFLLEISPDVKRLQTFVGKRLLDENQLHRAHRQLTHMLTTLASGGYAILEPPPPVTDENEKQAGTPKSAEPVSEPATPKPATMGTFGQLLQEAKQSTSGSGKTAKKHDRKTVEKEAAQGEEDEPYQPLFARPTKTLERLLVFRSVNPLYGDFLLKHLGLADENERIQLLESVMDIPGSVGRMVHVPSPERMPPGPLATERVDLALIHRGLATAEELYPSREEERSFDEERRFAIPLGDKVKMLFDAQFPGGGPLRVRSVWIAGDLLSFGGDFNAYVSGRGLAKQEGIIFRHLLRLSLLCGEFAELSPAELEPDEWRAELADLANRLAASCRAVDPESTDNAIEAAKRSPDIVAGEAVEESGEEKTTKRKEESFGTGLGSE